MPLTARGGQLAAHERVGAGLTATRRHLDGVVLERGDELADVVGIVLEVAVHGHDDAGARVQHARRHRRVLAEVALEQHDAKARIARVRGAQQRARAVGRAVVDEHDLPRTTPRGEGAREALHQLVDVAGLVEDRHDDAHIGPRCLVAGLIRREHGLLFSGRRHPPRVPIFGLVPLCKGSRQPLR